MKKVVAIILSFTLLLSLVACKKSNSIIDQNPSDQNSTNTNKTDSVENTPNNQVRTPEISLSPVEITTSPEATEEPYSDDILFKQTATIEETVLIDNDGLKVIANSLIYTDYWISVEVTIENNSDKDMTILSGTYGYGCNSVNGIMISDGYLNCDVKAGKKSREKISFDYDILLFYGINEIADIELGISAYDGDDYIYYPTSMIKTSNYNSYNYTNINPYDFIISKKGQTENKHSVKYSATNKLYDIDGVSIISELFIDDKYDNPMFILEVINKSSSQKEVSISDIEINGIMVCNGTWSSELINPGKTIFYETNLDSVFDKIYWDYYGVKEINNIRFNFGQKYFYGDKKIEDVKIEITISSGSESADTSGIVAYDEDGIRVIYKGISKGKYDFDKSLYVLLLIENNSGIDIYIDDDDVSINDYMADAIAYSTDISDGTCGIWIMDLNESSLEKCGIKEITDIDEIDFTLEIRDYNWSNKREGTAIIKIEK